MREADFVGSFESIEVANELTQKTLEQNREAVDEVEKGNKRRDFVKGWINHATGREAVMPLQRGAHPYVRTTYGVGVSIRHDRRSPRGFTVITSYPRND